MTAGTAPERAAVPAVPRGVFAMINRVCAGASALVFFTCQVFGGAFIEVTPGVVELSVQPDKSQKGQLTVKNPGDTTVLLKIDVRDEWKNRTTVPSIPPEQWLTLKYPKKFVLGPGESKTVAYIAKPPKDFTGEAMVMVIFSGPTNGVGINLLQGIPIYMTAKGTERVQLSLDKLQPSLNDQKQLDFVVDIRNTGNVHIRPQGCVRVTDSAGQSRGDIQWDYGAPVFPNTFRPYYAWSKKSGWEPGTYSAQVLVGEGRTPTGDPQSFTIGADGNMVPPKAVTPPPSTGHGP